jgi:hypothetical protein
VTDSIGTRLIARLVTTLIWWGFAWVFSWLIGLFYQTPAAIVFYLIGALATIAAIRGVVLDVNRWRVAAPTKVRTVAILSGLFWVSVAIGLVFIWATVEEVFNRVPESVRYWVPGIVSAPPLLFGLHSLLLGLFGSDERLARVMKAGGLPDDSSSDDT